MNQENEYKKDKTWSFWKVHLITLMIVLKKAGIILQLISQINLKHIECKNMPYQTIDSGLFYQKIINKLKQIQ